MGGLAGDVRGGLAGVRKHAIPLIVNYLYHQREVSPRNSKAALHDSEAALWL